MKKTDKELFERVMRLVEEITGQENHFNDLQTQYRKLASTWLLASFAACGYILKSSGLPYDEWYFVFGICMAASVGLSILWMLDLTVYQRLLAAYFLQGVKLEFEYYQWLTPSRINIIRSQRTGEVTSKMQYFYFFSIAVLQFLAILSIWNFKVLAGSIAEKIVYSSLIAGALLAVQLRLIRDSRKRRRKGKDAAAGREKVSKGAIADGGKRQGSVSGDESEIWQLIEKWELMTGASPLTGQ